MKGHIFTVGSGRRTLEEFTGILAASGISILVDVRRFPRSRFPWFRREPLAEALASRGIRYVYLGEELGGYRRGGYERYMKSDEFRRGMDRLIEAAAGRNAAVMCSEKPPWKCHRRFIGNELEQRGWKVSHLLEAGEVWAPPRQRSFPGKFL